MINKTIVGRSLATILLSIVYGLTFITLITLPRIVALKKKLVSQEK